MLVVCVIDTEQGLNNYPTPWERTIKLSPDIVQCPPETKWGPPEKPCSGVMSEKERLLTVTRIQRARYLDELTLVNADLKPDFVQTGSQKPSCGDPIQNRFRVADLGSTEYPPAASPLPTDPPGFFSMAIWPAQAVC